MVIIFYIISNLVVKLLLTTSWSLATYPVLLAYDFYMITKLAVTLLLTTSFSIAYLPYSY